MNYDRFKFRVWDCKEREYADEVYIALTGDSDLLQIGVCNYDDLDSLRYIIEQSTGIRTNGDRVDGKLIYWGDIVRIAGQGNTVINLHGYFDLLERVISGNSDDIESIVGNIHEAKE